MSTVNLVGLLVVAVLAAYLTLALLFPERF